MQNPDMQEQLNLAKKASENGNEQKAQAILLEALRQEPHNIAGLLMLAGSMTQSEKYREAAVVFEQLSLMLPSSGEVSKGLFNVLWQQELFEEALEEIRRFIQAADPEEERDTIKSYMKIIATLDKPNSEPEEAKH